MIYILITRDPGMCSTESDNGGREHGRKHCEGDVLHLTGADVDGVWHTIDVWETRPAPDRFAVEHQSMESERTGSRSGPDKITWEFEGEIIDRSARQKMLALVEAGIGFPH